MNATDNRDLLLEAIDNYDLYSKKQQSILKALVQVAINNVAEISTKSLGELLEISYQNTFIILRRLVSDGFIEKVKAPDQKYSSYRLIDEKLNYLIKLYYNKQSLSKK